MGFTRRQVMALNPKLTAFENVKNYIFGIKSRAFHHKSLHLG